MNIKNKLFVDENEIRDLCLTLKDKKTVLCHGHFNVIHPGHLRFLQHAKEHGERLIVAVTSVDDLGTFHADKFFTDEERAANVESLHIVNNVIILKIIKLPQLVELLNPDYWVMGREHESNIIKGIGDYADITKLYNGNLIYHSGSINYASSSLLDSSTNLLETSRNVKLKNACNINNINIDALIKRIDSFSKANILVIGDTIVDQFVACDPIGMSAESPVLVVKEIESKEFIGGAAIVAEHVKSLGAECHYISVIGDDNPGGKVEEDLRKYKISSTLFIDNERPTTYKIRYMVENQKMFRVSRLEKFSVATKIENNIISKLEEIIPKVDGIIICDFVYGVITPKILNSIIFLAKKNNVKLFGDLQCSSQIGSILKFKDFNLLTPTEKEARISLNDNDAGLEKVARNIIEKTNCKNLLLKLGLDGFIAYRNDSPKEASVMQQHFPALATNPLDTAGAGDTVLAVMSLCLSTGFNLMEASVLGACAASIVVNRIGNIPITLNDLMYQLKHLDMNNKS